MRPITLLAGFLGLVLAASVHTAEPPRAIPLDQAFDQLSTYAEGQSTAPLAAIERFVGRVSNDPAQRRQTAERLAGLLAKPQTTPGAKLFICQQLRVVGGDAQVPLLARMLDDPSTADMARLVLQVLPGDTAGQALLAALDRVRGAALVGVINSLGDRRETAAVKALTRFLVTPDASLAAAAASALGRVGNAEAATALAAVPPPSAQQPPFLEARLRCAQRLAQAGEISAAEAICRDLLRADLPASLRLAALSGLVNAAREKALPELLATMQVGDSFLAAFAIEQIRRWNSVQATAALRQALSKAQDPTRTLLLGALAERGEEAALSQLTALTKSAEPATRADATREMRRLRYAASAELRARLEEAPDAGDVAALTPEPYAPSVIQRRRQQVAAGLAPGDKLICYLDCGVEPRAQEGGVTIRQLTGQSYQFPNSETVAAPTFGTIAFDGGHVDFEIAGFDPQKRYALGFSWWDYDGGGRAQSVQFAGGEAGKRLEALASTRLPAYTTKKAGPATGQLPIEPALSARGKMRVLFTSQSGPNAVASELWLVETTPGSPSATNAVLSVVPVTQPVASATPKPPADLTPFSDGTRILLVTGDDYPGHPWQQTAPALKAILDQDPRLKVRIVEEPNALASPKLKEWDVVIIHFMDWEKPGPGPEARENLQQFVAGGKGLMLTHFACGAWDGNEWPEFRNLAGRVWGPKLRGHDPHGKFTVEIADPEHPITKGMQPFETLDDLYTCLAGEAPIHIVAKATSKVDQKDYPMAFVLGYGKGRVFHCVLGHDARAYAAPGVGELMRRGCAWAAGLAPSRP